MPAFVVTAVYFVRDVHMSPLQLVLTGTVMEVAVFVFEVPTGAIADTYGRRLSLIVAFLLQGAAIVVVGAVPVFWVIALAWFGWGIGATFASGAYEAWITDEVGAERVGAVFLRGARLAYEVATTAVTGGRFVRAQPLILLIVAIAFFTGMSSEALDRLWEAHFIRDVGLPRVGSLDPVVWFGGFGAASLVVG